MMCIIVFFKQKTAYEMRIRDWSSDVCSSDLRKPLARQGKLGTPPLAQYNRANRQDSAAEDGASGRGEDAKPHHSLDGGRIRSKIPGSGGNAPGRKGDFCSWHLGD